MRKKMKDDPSISINEIFYSIQGEGKFWKTNCFY